MSIGNKGLFKGKILFEFVNFGAAKIELFMLILLRASGVFALAPILSHKSTPQMARIGLVVLFAIILTSAIDYTPLEPTGSLVELLGIGFREFLIGALIGFSYTILFQAVYGAGAIVGYQVGFAMAMVLDPTSQTQQSVMSQLWFVIATLVFLVINGHHMVIQAFADSYVVMPPGFVNMSSSVGDMIIKITGYVFILGLRLAAPVLVTLFLTDVSLGVVAKMMPSMNIFVVGFPLKIGVGLVVLGVSLPAFSYVLERGAVYLDEQLGVMLLLMGKA